MPTLPTLVKDKTMQTTENLGEAQALIKADSPKDDARLVETLVSKIVKLPELADLLQILSSGGRLTTEQFEVLIGAVQLDDVSRVVLAKKLTGDAEEDLEEVGSLEDRLNEVGPRIRKAVRAILPEDGGILLTFTHKTTLVSLVALQPDGGITVVDRLPVPDEPEPFEIGGPCRAKHVGTKVDEVLTHAGILAGTIVTDASDLDESDESDDDEGED